jgi:phage tail-like protein
MRFVGALEAVLDPIVAVLDALPAHFNPDHAPRDILSLLASWLGVDLDESQSLRDRRELVRQAAELSRRRGTRRGLELALKLAFPPLPLRVEDNGGVTWKGEDVSRESPPASFVVYCDKPIPEETQAAIARCIEQYKPVHTTYRLRVKAAKKTE